MRRRNGGNSARPTATLGGSLAGARHQGGGPRCANRRCHPADGDVAGTMAFESGRGPMGRMSGRRLRVRDHAAFAGSHADLLIPHSELWSTSDRLVPIVTEKVNKYASLCADLGVPLVVVVAADPRSSVTVDTVRGAVTGALTLSMKLDMFADGPTSSGPLKLHQTDEARRWHPCLSAVGWLQAGIDDPGTLTLFSHQYASSTADVPVGGRIVSG